MIGALSGAERLLIVGIGGGGDVVGAAAIAEAARLLDVESVVGGLTWERRPIDPQPGPRRLEEITGIQPLNARAALAGPDAAGPGGFRFAEAHVARVTGEPTLLLDPGGGPEETGSSLAGAAVQLGCDVIVLVDVGGDALAHGDEPGLASPLADAVCLAGVPHAQVLGAPVLGAVFGAGCDGELTPAEVLERLAEVTAAGGGRGAIGLEPVALARVEEIAAAVPTEASAMALQCARGAFGTATIREGRRTVELSPVGGVIFGFDPVTALGSAARCAAAVGEARSLPEANALLNARGIRTELDFERGSGPVPPPNPGSAAAPSR